jgi:uncharacterized protein YdaU (DUF1376 family)
MKRAWMPLYVGDYLGDTGHLTTAQHGAYLLLMMHYWRKGELPDDDRQLAKITKLTHKTWRRYRPVLQEFFHSGWKHKRIDTELMRMLRISEKRVEAGQKGGFGSALSRMKLEIPVQRQRSPQAIARQMPSKAAANVDHSHSHSQNLSSEGTDKKTEVAPSTKPGKTTIAVSAELAALMARKS